MHKREQPREIPDSPAYFTTAVDGLGECQWRMPFPLIQARLLALVRVHSPAAEAVEAMQERAERIEEAFPLWCVGGAAIGLSWAAVHADLDTPEPEGGDLLAYGESVLNELHEAGWPLRAISAAYSAIFARMRTSQVPAQEVRDLLGFTAPRTDKAS